MPLPTRIGPGGPFISSPPRPSSDVVVVDDGDSWWAGQINSIPALTGSTAIGLAVSLALGFQTEDFSPRPMGAGSDSLRTLAIGSDVPRIPTADDDIGQQPASIVEELEQQNSFVALAKIPVAFTADDDIVPVTTFEEVELQQYVVVPVAARQVLSADEEIVPQATPLNIDEDYYQQPAADPFSVRIVSIQTGGSPLLATFNPDEDYELQRTFQWKARWYALSPDEEITSVAATGFADEDYQVDMQARIGPVFYILPATDDDLPITTADAGVSSPLSFGQRARHGIGFKRWESTEELPFSAGTLSIEEADWQAPQPAIPAAKSLLTVDEEIVPQPVPLNIDEFYKLNLYVSPEVYKVSVPIFVENDVPILIAPAVTSLVEWLVRARRRGVR